MNPLFSTSKVQSFTVNIAAGADSGLIGTYNTPIMLPAGARVKYISVTTTTQFVGAGALMSLGWAGFTGNLILAFGIAGQPFANLGTVGGDPFTDWGGALNLPAVGAQTIQFKIGGANITAGAATFYIEYY